jgi:hypothetical protein
MQVCVQYRSAAECGNTPYEGKEYYHEWLCGAIAHKLFLLTTITKMNEASSLTHGGDAFGKELIKDRRFGSSGLNLTFEGLLLGSSLRLRAKPTSSNPL